MDKKVEILLFEDNPGDANLIEEMLEEFADFPYKLKNVETLNEGLNLLKEHPFDVILSDLRLPDSDGVDTFLEIYGINSRVPIIILTGMNDERIGIDAVKSGAQDYLVKGQVDGRLLNRSIRYSIERKKAEDKIQGLANIVESSDDAIMTESLDGVITSWNRGAERIYGYSSEEILGKHISVLAPPLLVEETKELVERIKRGERIRHYETSRLRKDGIIINVSITLSPVLNDFKKLTAISIIARDITKRKRAEEELQRSEERYRIVTGHTGQLIYDHDLKTDKINWAGNIEEVTGYSPREFQEFSFEAWTGYIHPGDREFVLEEKCKIRKKGGNYEGEFRFRKKDGTYFHAEDSEVCLTDETGLPYRVLGVLKDVTEKKLAVEKLKKSEERTHSYLQNFRGIGVLLDGNFVPIFLHGAIEELTGYTKEDFLSGKIRWHEIVEPEDRSELQEKAQKMKNTPNMTVKHEYRIRKKDGEVRWIHGIAQNISEPGNKELYQGLLYDITDRKMAEESLNKMEKIRKKEIHHRIKNNLQVISSLLDLQAEYFDDERVKQAFRESQNRVISMALIHEELYESGETGTLNFAAYMQKLLEHIFRCYDTGDSEFHLLLEIKEKTFFDMDTAVPLGIIVNELVSNSLKHAFPDRDEGVVKIKLYREENGGYRSNIVDNNGVENTKEENKNTDFVMTISDNGVGLPESINLEQTETLGLQLVSILVDQLEGELELKRNCGTEFIIKIAIKETQ
ncbi:PAS domain S-box protein [Methanosarcina sp. T3]|uniref:PAS domain S-box protein n=1 Tax=Methanosarcina sp. T3 TaxID=3439062 RepID=UPI003F86E53A